MATSPGPSICIFGLGEAGALIAADLVAAGATVAAFDPAGIEAPEGVQLHDSATEAVVGAELIMSVTTPARAPAALSQALEAIGDDAIYADLSTGSPNMKRGLALTADRADIPFADVALLSSIPGVGLRARALASGSGGERYAELLKPLGADVSFCGEEAGKAASRKYLRAIMLRGVGAIAVEALQSGHSADDVEWLWSNMTEEISAGDNWLEESVTRLGPFAQRRRRELDSCLLYLNDLGVDPIMTRSTIEMLRRIEANGLPTIP